MLGNVTGGLDASGLVQSHVWMEAFGTVLSGGQAGRRLTTKTYDADAGLYYFSARWYDTRSGLFDAVDSFAVFPLYRFANQRPTVSIDWNGLYPWNHNGTWYDWPECNIDELLRHTDWCDPCDLSMNMGSASNSWRRLVDAMQGGTDGFVRREGADPVKVASGVTTNGKPLFNPNHPKVGGDLCAMSCTCLHEWVHVIQSGLGIQKNPDNYYHEILPYAAGGICSGLVVVGLLFF